MNFNFFEPQKIQSTQKDFHKRNILKSFCENPFVSFVSFVVQNNKKNIKQLSKGELGYIQNQML